VLPLVLPLALALVLDLVRLPARARALVPALPFVLLAGCAGSGGETHDVVPQSHDVQVNTPQGGASAQGYDYVAKRPLGVVALAEARGLDPVVAHAAIDRLADALDACATDEGRKGTLADGAARVVVQIDDKGNVAGTSLKVDPGAGVAQNAVVCLVAPLRSLSFPPADSSTRGFAIEALWGRVVAREGQGGARQP
jgi:hypothetical protein